MTPPEERTNAIILEVNDAPTLDGDEQLYWRYLTWLEQSVIGQHFGTVYARAPIACSVVSDPQGDSRLVPFHDLLRGPSFVNIAPSGLNGHLMGTYELRMGDDIVGYIVPKASKYVFQPTQWESWSSNEERTNDTRVRECGMTILNIALSTTSGRNLDKLN